MKMLFVADLHYTLKQFDWVMANATKYDPIIIGGDLLDLSSALDPDIQIAVIEKYLYRLLQQTRVVVCSGNHDLDSRNAAGEAVAGWLYDAKAANLFLDGTSVELSGALLTICPWWDGAVSRAEVEAELALPAGMIKRPWVDRIAKTWVFNVGRQPGPWPTYIVLDPGTMTAEWTSFEKQSVQRLTMADR